jgi:hypothetical protein
MSEQQLIDLTIAYVVRLTATFNSVQLLIASMLLIVLELWNRSTAPVETKGYHRAAVRTVRSLR